MTEAVTFVVNLKDSKWSENLRRPTKNVLHVQGWFKGKLLPHLKTLACA